MRHSRGRGRRGGRGGRGTDRNAPKLPFKLRQELNTDNAAPKHQRGSGSMFAVSRRKEERKRARHGGRGRGSAAPGGRHSKDFKHFSSRPEEDEGTRPRVGSKRPAEQRVEAPAGRKKTKFGELLGHAGPQAISKEAFEAEDALQRQLAKKLGIKGKKRKVGAPAEKPSAEEPGVMFEGDDSAAGEGSDSEADSSSGESDDNGLLGDGLSSSDDEELQDPDEGEDDESEEDDSKSTGQGGSFGLDSDSEPEEETGKSLRSKGTTAKDPGKHEGGAIASAQRYVPPAVRSGLMQGTSERLTKRVKGLLNRLAEANVQPTVEEAAGLLQSEGRRPAMQALTQELLQAVAGGPRATDRFAAVTAAFVSGLAGTTRAVEVVAFFLESAASRLEEAVKSEDSLAAGNLMAVIAHMYGCKVIDAATMYSLLEHLQSRFSEQDVALIFSLLSIAGFQLRSDDPAAMKDFVQSAHSRAAEASEKGSLSTRAQVLLGLVLDIKNNRQRSQGAGGPLTISSVLSAGVLKWLKGCGTDEVQLRNLPWELVLQENKKGLWWQPTASSQKAQPSALAQSLADAEGGGGLLALAAAQRMNTETRRAVFCIVMGSQDAVDASERLLRLPLKGEAQREVVRVTVECCLQERAWNGYYAQLLGSLVRTVKGHRITLQFCLWDLIKGLDDGNARRMIHLARLIATLIASKAVPVTILKVVDFADVMTARQLLFWRVVFEELLQRLDGDPAVQDVFARFGGPGGALSAERNDLIAFLRRHIGPWLAEKHQKDDVLLGRLRAAEIGLSAAAAHK